MMWSDHCTSLRDLWGTPDHVKNVVLRLARQSGFAEGEGMQSSTPVDPLMEHDPWAAFAKGKTVAEKTRSVHEVQKFEALQVLSDLVADGKKLQRLKITELDEDSSGYSSCILARWIRQFHWPPR
eukprot:6470521-Amphidinium_carterae.1